MIKLENVSKYYYSANSVVPALRKINLELGIGEFVAITGESGSGKSTLLNIISGLDTYDDGELYINQTATSYYDEADWEDYRKNKIGFVFQNYGLIDNYSVLYNVESSLLIQGCDNNEAKKKAKELLGKVGLSDKLSEKAINLSSGQKQRLSIARALAKATDIIVADEPTGNLDSETGKQIMELFSELSKDRLIIIVTHNYEEARPYVTRKIRVHDGEIVMDTPVGQPDASVEEGTCEEPITTPKVTAAQKKAINSDRRIAWRFTLMNITTQPKRVILFMVLLLMTAASTFIFLGEIYSHWDDTYTKTYDPSAFLNFDNTRIIVTKQDESEISEEDLKVFNSIKYVTLADKYGFSNDINYYITLNKDYNYINETSDTSEGKKVEKTAKFLDSSHFVKSSTCITENDLSAGRLPKSRNEIVIYSKDKKVIKKEKRVYFTATNIWGYGQYYTTKVKIVGILKNNCNQVYFSGELCNMLSAELYGDSYSLDVNYDILKGNFTDKTSFVPVIGEEIKDESFDDDKVPVKLKIADDVYVRAGKVIPGKARLNFYGKDKDKDYAADYLHLAEISQEYNIHSACFVEMSEQLFYKLFKHKSSQAGIYIKDYIYTDRVLKQLKDKGYIAVSSYRVSSVNYNYDMLAERNKIMLQAMIVLLIVGMAEIAIIKSIFKIKHNTFVILGSMGMGHKAIKHMNYYEMLLYTAAAVLVVILAANILRLFSIDYLDNMIKYYNLKTYFIYTALNLLAISIAVWSFNRYLKRKQKWV